jgi:hypothetical protein
VDSSSAPALTPADSAPPTDSSSSIIPSSSPTDVLTI